MVTGSSPCRTSVPQKFIQLLTTRRRRQQLFFRVLRLPGASTLCWVPQLPDVCRRKTGSTRSSCFQASLCLLGAVASNWEGHSSSSVVLLREHKNLPAWSFPSSPPSWEWLVFFGSDKFNRPSGKTSFIIIRPSSSDDSGDLGCRWELAFKVVFARLSRCLVLRKIPMMPLVPLDLDYLSFSP